jgi:hypothetical protein
MVAIVCALQTHVYVRICVPDAAQKEHVMKVLAGEEIPTGQVS